MDAGVNECFDKVFSFLDFEIQQCLTEISPKSMIQVAIYSTMKKGLVEAKNSLVKEERKNGVE